MPKIYLPLHGFHVHLGKLDPKPVEGAVDFKDVRAAFVKAGGTLPKRPANWGHADDFDAGSESTVYANGKSGWGMLGNGPCDDGSITDTSWAAYEGAGDCAIAAPCHDEMEAATGSGRPTPVFTSLSALEQYAAFTLQVNGTAYNLQTGAGDTGCVIADVIQWRQTTGLKDSQGNVYKLGAAITGTPGDLDEAFEMSYLLNTADLGFSLTQAQMDQFDSGQPWDYVAGSADIGGHCVPMPGQRIVTWGEPHRFTAAFYEHQNDEIHGSVDPEQYNAVTGEDAQMHTEIDVEKWATMLAQQSAA